MRIKARGFTLIEICVALLIFSIISVAISVSFQQVMRNKTVTDKHQATLSQLQIAFFMMSRDLTQAVSRSGFVPLKRTAVFIGTPTSFQFVRTGNTNPLFMERRSDLQVVSYEFLNKQLVRAVRLYVDVDAKQQAMLPRVLFEPLEPTSDLPVFRYLDNDNQWQPVWPPLDKPVTGLPKAVQAAFFIPEQGNITQLYLVANTSGVN